MGILSEYMQAKCALEKAQDDIANIPEDYLIPLPDYPRAQKHEEDELLDDLILNSPYGPYSENPDIYREELDPEIDEIIDEFNVWHRKQLNEERTLLCRRLKKAKKNLPLYKAQVNFLWKNHQREIIIEALRTADPKDFAWDMKDTTYDSDKRAWARSGKLPACISCLDESASVMVGVEYTRGIFQTTLLLPSLDKKVQVTTEVSQKELEALSLEELAALGFHKARNQMIRRFKKI